MTTTQIFKIIYDEMKWIKRDRRTPGAIVVSSEIMYEIQNGYYNEKEAGSPFFPDFSQMQKEKFDKLFGIPLSVISTTNKEYIKVYPEK